MATLAPASKPTGNSILDAFSQYHDKVSAMTTGAGRDMSPRGTPPPPSTAVGTIGKPSEGIGNLTAYVDPSSPGWGASSAASQAIQTATKQPDSSINTDKLNMIASNLRKDYGLTREQAIGAVGWMGYESGNMSVMQEYGHSGVGSGWGWAQWTGPRRTDFMNYAMTNKLDPASDEANYGFLKHELDTNYSHVIPRLKETSTVEEANQAWGKYYEGMREGGPGVPAFAQHAQRAALYDTLIPKDQTDDQGSIGAYGPQGSSGKILQFTDKPIDQMSDAEVRDGLIEYREKYANAWRPGRPDLNDLSNLGGPIPKVSGTQGASFNWEQLPRSNNVKNYTPRTADEILSGVPPHDEEQ